MIIITIKIDKIILKLRSNLYYKIKVMNTIRKKYIDCQSNPFKKDADN